MDKKNIIILILAILLTAVIVGGGVYLWQQNIQDETKTQESVVTTQVEDENIEEEIAEPEEVQPDVDVKDVFVGLLATRHSRDAADAQVTIDENTGTHAKGLVIFAGDIGGGWWLAAKTGGNWVIVADGNGTVMCSDIAPYNFPTSMVPECWDEATQVLITR